MVDLLNASMEMAVPTLAVCSAAGHGLSTATIGSRGHAQDLDIGAVGSHTETRRNMARIITQRTTHETGGKMSMYVCIGGWSLTSPGHGGGTP